HGRERWDLQASFLTMEIRRGVARRRPRAVKRRPYSSRSRGGERQVGKLSALNAFHAQRPPADRDVDRRGGDERREREQRGGIGKDETMEHGEENGWSVRARDAGGRRNHIFRFPEFLEVRDKRDDLLLGRDVRPGGAQIEHDGFRL